MTLPPSLDYAAVRPSRVSAAQRRLIMAACCLGGSWLVWLCIGLATFDPFDDPLVGWLLVTTVGMGTLCGLIVYVVALLGLWLRFAVRRRRASAS